jgi:hypothetical protein
MHFPQQMPPKTPSKLSQINAQYFEPMLHTMYSTEVIPMRSLRFKPGVMLQNTSPDRQGPQNRDQGKGEAVLHVILLP